MKKRIVTIALGLLLGASISATVTAAPKKGNTVAVSAEDLAALRGDMQALADRVQKLEQSNHALTAENAELKQKAEAATQAAGEVKQVQADVDSTVDQLARTRAALPEWASRVSFKGDLRYRHEEIRSSEDRVASPGLAAVSSQDRSRDRIRLRFGVGAKVNDHLLVNFQLATGGDDPRSSNQTLGGYSTRKPIAIDLANFEWTPSAAWKVTGGKMKFPWFRPAQSLFFDNDVNPEGLAVNFNQGYFFASAFGFWLNEIGAGATGAAAAGDHADPKMAGGQLGIKYPFSSTSSLTAGLSYFGHGALKERAISTFYAGSANGNSTVNFGTVAAPDLRLRDDFNIGEVFAEYATAFSTETFGDLPVSFFGEYAKNDGAADFDDAYTAGFFLGKASAPHSWELGYLYEKMGKNAIFGQWVDSDFGAGNTGSNGHVFKAGYAPSKNMVFNLTYFLNKLNVDTGTPASSSPERNYDRLQVDFNYKY